MSVSKYSDLPRLLCVLRERKRERLLRSKDVQVSEGQMKREKKRKNEKRDREREKGGGELGEHMAAFYSEVSTMEANSTEGKGENTAGERKRERKRLVMDR